MRRERGYTLTELLVVLAIITLLASVLMPALRAARESAKQAKCISNFRQLVVSTQIYLGDYDDRHVPLNHRPGQTGPPGVDRTWVQIVLPYARSYAIFRCPSDYGAKRGTEGVFDGDLVPSDTDQRFFLASQRTNFGYNHQYLAPVVRSNNQWVSLPRYDSQISERSRTVMFVDSAWAVDASQKPYGGGRWIVAPPCRYEMRGVLRADTFATEGEAWSPDSGWTSARGVLPFGGAWAWHSTRVNVIRIDGSAKSMSIEALTAGCNAQPNWAGVIVDSSQYVWDLR